MTDTRRSVREIVLSLGENREAVGLPAEPVASYPLPRLVSGQLCLEFFFIPWEGFPPQPMTLFPPIARMALDLTGRRVHVGPAPARDYGLDVAPRAPLGPRVIDPPLSMEDYRALETRMHERLDALLRFVPTFPAELDEESLAAAVDWKQAFDRVAQKPLLPFYRGTNPEFFAWIEAQVERAGRRLAPDEASGPDGTSAPPAGRPD